MPTPSRYFSVAHRCGTFTLFRLAESGGVSTAHRCGIITVWWRRFTSCPCQRPLRSQQLRHHSGINTRMIEGVKYAAQLRSPRLRHHCDVICVWNREVSHQRLRSYNYGPITAPRLAGRRDRCGRASLQPLAAASLRHCKRCSERHQGVKASPQPTLRHHRGPDLLGKFWEGFWRLRSPGCGTIAATGRNMPAHRWRCAFAAHALRHYCGLSPKMARAAPTSASLQFPVCGTIAAPSSRTAVP